MKIPKQLQIDSARFIKIEKQGKKPTEKWGEKQYKFNDPELLQWIDNNGNVAIINKSCKLTVIDADNKQSSNMIAENLPQTFMVKTRENRYHVYYRTSTSTIGKKNFKNGIGDIRGWRDSKFYTIIPPSIHQDTGKPYTSNTSKIQTIEEKQLLDLFKEYIIDSSIKRNTKNVSLKGVEEGNRTDNIKRKSINLRANGYSEEDALMICLTINQNNKPPLLKEKIKDVVHSMYAYEHLLDSDGKYTSLNDLYIIVKKWLRIKDTNRIDTILATVITNQLQGTPVWLTNVGASGDGKTELTKPLEALENDVILLDQLTKNTLASGKKGASDLGSELENKSTVLLILDFASLLSKNKDDKNEIFGQFRLLHDGKINKKTGSGINKNYKNCHVTVIGCATPMIRNEYHIHNQLGTREFFYDTKEKLKTDEEKTAHREKMKKAWGNENFENEMKAELKEAYKSFLQTHPIKNIEDKDIPKNIENFIYDKTEELRILRAVGIFNYRNNEIVCDVEMEEGTRLVKQFKKLYKGLKSLDDNYPDRKTKEIIQHIVDSTGNKIRQKILKIIDNKGEAQFTIREIANEMRIAYETAKKELSVLWNLKILDRTEKWEIVGGIETTDNDGYKSIRGGFSKQIIYYWKSIRILPQNSLF